MTREEIAAAEAFQKEAEHHERMWEEGAEEDAEKKKAEERKERRERKAEEEKKVEQVYDEKGNRIWAPDEKGRRVWAPVLDDEFHALKRDLKMALFPPEEKLEETLKEPDGPDTVLMHRKHHNGSDLVREMDNKGVRETLDRFLTTEMDIDEVLEDDDFVDSLEVDDLMITDDVPDTADERQQKL